MDYKLINFLKVFKKVTIKRSQKGLKRTNGINRNCKKQKKYKKV